MTHFHITESFKQIMFSLILAVLFYSNSVSATECADQQYDIMPIDPQVSLEILEHKVKPLTRCELAMEAMAWLEVLKETVSEISSAEIALLQIQSSTEKKPANNDQSSEQPSADLKASQDPSSLIKSLSNLKLERSARIDRLNILLSEWKQKGGDIAELEHYIKSVSGIQVAATGASPAWAAVTNWFTSPKGGYKWAKNFLKFFILIFIFYILALFISKAVETSTRKSKNLSALLRKFMILSTRRIILLVGFFVGLSTLGINMGPVLTIIGAAGFVIAFALQNSLSNFASGILMLVYRPFDIGEIVKVAGTLGTVESMNLLSTQLRTLDNQLVVVPNNSVWGDVITNVTGITQRRIDLMFGIGYKDDIDKAQKILEEIVSEDSRILKDPASVVRLHELGDSSVNFVCRPWVKPEDYWDVYWDVTREVKLRFDANGISIPFPQRDVHIYQQS